VQDGAHRRRQDDDVRLAHTVSQVDCGLVDQAARQCRLDRLATPRHADDGPALAAQHCGE
jgi:hypothetical protein